MIRAQRLLKLIHLLQRYRYPVRGEHLAQELGISLRTLYRDIHTLQQQGARIDGEAGVGYQLRSGFMLPPLMFSKEEMESLVLGVRWISQHGDKDLVESAKSVLTKIRAVLPDDVKHYTDTSALLVGPASVIDIIIDISQVREAIRQEQKINIVYQDANNNSSERLIWPFALAYFEKVRIIVGWCELRQATRHFRVDRIAQIDYSYERYPSSRAKLLKQWYEQEGISVQ